MSQLVAADILAMGFVAESFGQDTENFPGWLQTIIEEQEALLSSVSPLAVLQRGYSITRRLSDGKIVRNAGWLTLDDSIRIQMAQGVIQARVEKIREE